MHKKNISLYICFILIIPLFLIISPLNLFAKNQNDLPILTAKSRIVKVGDTISVLSLFNVSNLNGGPILRYQIYNKTGKKYGSINLNGVKNILGDGYQSVGYFRVLASDMSRVTYSAGNVSRRNTLYLWVYNNKGWSKKSSIVIIIKK